MTIFNRRTFLATGLALAFTPSGGMALTEDAARVLVRNMVADINKIINSGKSESAMIKDFEKLFVNYADVNIIARSALGPAARSISKAELNNYTTAFRGYVSRKYGRRFREFIGGDIAANKVAQRGKYFEVVSTMTLQGRGPIEMVFRVSDRSGKDLIFDIIIEGISLLSTEAVEIRSLLDKRNGDVGKLTDDLKRL